MKNTMKTEFMTQISEEEELNGQWSNQEKEVIFFFSLLEQLTDEKVNVSLGISNKSTIMSNTYNCFNFQWLREVKNRPETDCFILNDFSDPKLSTENRLILKSDDIASVFTLEDPDMPLTIFVTLSGGLNLSLVQLN